MRRTYTVYDASGGLGHVTCAVTHGPARQVWYVRADRYTFALINKAASQYIVRSPVRPSFCTHRVFPILTKCVM